MKFENTEIVHDMLEILGHNINRLKLKLNSDENIKSPIFSKYYSTEKKEIGKKIRTLESTMDKLQKYVEQTS